LGSALQELDPLVEQGRVEGFFTNVENAGTLGSLVEDIHDAMMDYQVFICERSTSQANFPDFHTRLRYNKTFMTRVVGSL